jgi:hypothetical protein
MLKTMDAPLCATDEIVQEIADLEASILCLNRLMAASHALRMAYMCGDPQQRLEALRTAQHLLEGEL